MDFCPAGLATGIGSLPFVDPGQALDLIWENMPCLPHWPQLPQRGEGEGFIYQFLSPLIKTGVLTVEGERAFFNTTGFGWVERLTDFYTLYLQIAEGDNRALEEFAFSREAAGGFYAFEDRVKTGGVQKALYFKGQLTGPVTVGLQLKDEKGKFAYYNEQLRDLIVKALALHARWQAQRLGRLGRPAIIFIDEPAAGIYGQSTFITVTKEMITTDLGEIIEAISGAGALAGAHSCDAIDWSIFLNSGLSIVNLDAYNFGESLHPYVPELKSFLERGGVLAWGIVPTSEKAWKESKESLSQKLFILWEELEKRGISQERLKKQSLVTPACGAGLLPPELAWHIYQLNREVSEICQGDKCHGGSFY